MRRIYLPIILLLCIASFWAGYKVGTPSIDAGTAADIERNIDSLNVVIYSSKIREQAHWEAVERDSAVIIELKQAIKERDIRHTKTQKEYAVKIQQARKYTLSKLDSFFIHRFPRPGVTVRLVEDSTMDGANDSSAIDTVRFIRVRPREAAERLSRSISDSVSQRITSGILKDNHTREKYPDRWRAKEDYTSNEIFPIGQKIQTPTKWDSRWRRHSPSYRSSEGIELIKTAYHRSCLAKYSCLEKEVDRSLVLTLSSRVVSSL